jgi:hypothetical protein
MLPGTFIISAVASVFVSHFLLIRVLNALVKSNVKFEAKLNRESATFAVHCR